jgi:Flp pilus assembly pilin Flp
MLQRLWLDDEGVLTFEWILLLTLVVIGVIGGIAGIRDAINHEAQGTVGAVVSLDQSYFVAPPLGVGVQSYANESGQCTSASSRSAFGDDASWAAGRPDQNEFNQDNQTNSVTTLCPIP